jgi:hypothetical protein
MQRSRLLITICLAGLLLVAISPVSASAQDSRIDGVHVFFRGDCGDCRAYVKATLIPALTDAGLTADPQVHDLAGSGGRELLARQAGEVGLPPDMVDWVYAFVAWHGSDLVLLGRIPRTLLDLTLTDENLPERLVVQQPLMDGEPEEFRVWAFTGEVQSYPIDACIQQAIFDLQRPGSTESLARGAQPEGKLAALMSGVREAGLNGVDAYAFALIPLLVAFVWAFGKRRRQM